MVTTKSVAAGIALTAMGIAGCGGFLSHRNLDRDLNASVGQDVHVVIKKIGYPTRQSVLAGDKIYTWEDNGCTINVAVDQSERITHFDFSGGHHDCENL